MNSPASALNYQLLRLGAVLELERRARAAAREELGFLIVNETAGVVPYQQAVLWQDDASGDEPLVLSGVASAERGGPYYIWLERVFEALTREGAGAPGAEAGAPRVVSPADLPQPLANEWPEWFPAEAILCPLGWRDSGPIGYLLLGRADAWTDSDQQLLEALSGAYAQSLLLHRRARKPGIAQQLAVRKRPLAIAAVVLLLIAIIPVRESVLAPAEVVPIDPAPVRAPFDGVVGSLRVEPNQAVRAGQPLVSFDQTQLQTRYEVAKKALDMAREEYADTSQQAMSDDRAKARLAMLESKVDQDQAEVAYDEDMLRRAQITAPVDGVAIFDDSSEWIGKPVVLGERIMVVASPARTQLQIEVPASSVVSFKPGAEVVFFSNLQPDRPAYGALTFASYSTTVAADGVMSYAFRASLDHAPTLRLGLKGTAKIYGPRRVLVLWLLRRPLTVMREWLSI
ncbi:efflux RND transporter periplasmic adaptor subunit [Trinickia dinghuensis]|uniref:HlyD family efflux transporter periplasmic adaptor subunit n=1 Tax=Trinickia dinghuensis TaxID=2291023 RepID=A0A3D8K066_9BURK|nr:HlyD family efflux transporter periplasmic adaptor subunit [Trinickia dinghuensis]RDU97991.1 HlyD family efflux transporter periplasmic adaptor subunit [Trinickia dinghuensis]